MSDLTPTSRPASFTLPADYYASPVTARPIFPKWVPTGCGIASAVLLVLAFAAGAIVMTVGVGKLLASVITSTHGELKPMYGADIPPAKRAQLDEALDGISRDLASDKLAYAKLEPLLNTMKDAMDDKKITNAEADQLLAKVAEVRKPAPRSSRDARPSPGPSRRSGPPSPGGRGK